MNKPRRSPDLSATAERAALQEALEALRESEARFRAVIDSAN